MESIPNLREEILKTARKITNPDISNEELINADYLEKGIFDSFQMVEFITQLESQFRVKFSLEDLTSHKFRTIAGINQIISEYRTKQ